MVEIFLEWWKWYFTKLSSIDEINMFRNYPRAMKQYFTKFSSSWWKQYFLKLSSSAENNISRNHLRVVKTLFYELSSNCKINMFRNHQSSGENNILRNYLPVGEINILWMSRSYEWIKYICCHCEKIRFIHLQLNRSVI